MGIDRIRREWTGMEGNPYGQVWLWDDFSEDFDRYPLPGDDDPLIRAIEGRRGFRGSTVLDIGCGSGQYLAYAAQRCRSAVGIDLSERMASNARTRCSSMGLANVSVATGDWEDPAVRMALGGPFDIVFARMTPAIGSAAALEAMCGCCSVAGFVMKAARRKDEVMDALTAALGLDISSVRWADEEVPMIYEMLWDLGYEPRVDYGKDFWDNKRSLEKAAEYYGRVLTCKYGIGEDGLQEVRRVLEAMSVGGMVRDATDVTTVLISWDAGIRR